MKNKQIAIKPQDLFIMLKLASNPGYRYTYAALAETLGIAASEVHAGIARAIQSRLVTKDENGFHLVRATFADFLIMGASFCFPAVIGPPTRGIPTSYAAAPLREFINQPDELPPVWPTPQGTVRGTALYPLYPSIPIAALKDQILYENLALFDALRAGAAREREFALKILRERL